MLACVPQLELKAQDVILRVVLEKIIKIATIKTYRLGLNDVI